MGRSSSYHPICIKASLWFLSVTSRPIHHRPLRSGSFFSALTHTSRQVSDQHQKKPFFIIMSYLIFIIFLKNLFVNRTKCSISETINHESGHTRHQQGLHILQRECFPLLELSIPVTSKIFLLISLGMPPNLTAFVKTFLLCANPILIKLK